MAPKSKGKNKNVTFGPSAKGTDSTTPKRRRATIYDAVAGT
jgi:hypothetical protein